MDNNSNNHVHTITVPPRAGMCFTRASAFDILDELSAVNSDQWDLLLRGIVNYLHDTVEEVSPDKPTQTGLWINPEVQTDPVLINRE